MINNYTNLSLRSKTRFKIGAAGATLGATSTKAKGFSWLVVLFVLLSMAVSQRTSAQSSANYAFSTSTTGSLGLDMNGNAVDMSTGASALVAAGSDQGVSPLTNLGFTFYHMGSAYSQFTVSANGILQLGTSVVSGSTYVVSGGTATAPKIGALGADMVTASIADGGGITSKLVGTGSTRCMVIQFVEYVYWLNSSPAATWQIRLYESTGVIEFVYGSMAVGATTYSSNYTIGFSVNTTANTLASVTTSTNTVSTASFTTNAYVANAVIPNLNSVADGSRRVYRFTPNSVAPSDPSTLTFTAITASTVTPNWIDNSTTETGFIVTRATDAGFTQNVVSNTVVSTTSAGTGTAYLVATTGLTPGTTYYYKVQSVVEAAVSPGITNTTSTPAAVAYYWVGATGGSWSVAANWNSQADGLGAARTTAATTDILIVDGAGTIAGGALTITIDVASYTIGQLLITSATDLSLVGAGAARTLTISGSPGDDLVVESGSVLNLTASGTTPNFAVTLTFSGTGNTGLIAGTYNVLGSTANNIIATAGTGTLVTVTGSVFNAIAGTSGCFTGSVTTLLFANGSNYTHSGFTTGNAYIPTAAWGGSSNVFITGGTTGTGLTGANQSFGNFTYNTITNSGATFSAFTFNTGAIIKGDLTIIDTKVGKFRALTTGTLTVLGNLNVLGSSYFEVASSSGTLIVNGNVNVSGGTFDVSQAGNSTLRVLGNFIQSGSSSLTQTSATGTIEFAGIVPQTFTLLSGFHGTNLVSARINNAAGVVLTSDFSARNLTVSNGTITGATIAYGASSILTYNSTTAAQLITGIEWPAVNGPASLTINNTATSPNNVVTLSSPRTLGVGGFLTLTNGILFNSGNLLTVSNPLSNGVVGGSATSYVKGDLSRDLVAGLATGTTYNFPIGFGSYNPFALVNPTTISGTIVSVKATVSDTNTGGVAAGVLGSINMNRTWAIDVTDPQSNFIGTSVRLSDTPAGADAIGFSSDGGLTYTLFGGTSATVAATSITSTAPASPAIEGFFAMGTKVNGPALSALAISPTGNQCTNVSRTVTVTTTAGAVAVTGVVINYTVNGVAQSPIAMTNVGDNWSGTLPTVSPVNATVAWSVVVTDANSFTATQAGTSYTDEPNFGYVPTAVVSNATTCSGQATTLTASLIANGTAIVGAGATTSSSTAATFFPGAWGGAKTQYIVRASELTAAGLTAGAITSLGFDVVSVGQTYQGFRVQLGHTAATAMTTTFLSTPMTQVYLGTLADDGYLPTAGVNTLAFGTGAGSSSSFVWDGTSNVVVNICWSRVPSASTSTATSMLVDAAGFTSSAYEQSDSSTPAVMCAKVTADGTGSNRPKFRFAGVKSLPISLISWSDGSTTVGNTASISVSPTTTTTYSATITANGCVLPASNSVVVTVNPLPTAPTAISSAQCGSQVPTATVADVNAFVSPTFKWYATNVSTTALQTSTATTYGTAINSTTTLYVSVTNPVTLCESTRTPVTITVAPPAPIVVVPVTATVCQNGTVSLGASSSAAYSYSWTASPEAGSGILNASPLLGASVNVTPTGTGTYVYTVSGVEGSCASTNSITVTITPAEVVVISAPAPLCPGGSTTLTATSSTLAAGPQTAPTGYLASSATSPDDEEILNVTFGTLNNTSACGSTGGAGSTTNQYSNYTALAAPTVTAGTTVPVSISVGTCGGNYGNFTNVYIDYNRNGSFETAERAFSSPASVTGPNTVTGSITIPLTAMGGVTRMRVFNIEGGSISSSPSSTYTWGETEDYNINIIGAVDITSTLTYTWNDPAVTVGNVVTVSPLVTTTYQVGAYNPATGCTGYQSVTVIVNTPPTAPLATATAQCGSGVPTVSVADTNGYASPIYRWYADNTATTPLQTGASATFTSSISTTTTFYVSVTSLTAGCESARTPVIATVNTIGTISVSGGTTVCAGTPATLTAAEVTGTMVDYFWTPSTGLSATSGSSVIATPAVTTTYSVKGIDGNGCSTPFVTVTVVVSPTPTAITVTPSATQLCAGSVVTLTSAGGASQYSPSVTLGTGTATTSSAGITPFDANWEGSRTQYLITAAELSSIAAGNLTSISFNVTGGSNYVLSNYAIKLASTADTSLSGGFGTPVGAFTTVYANAALPLQTTGLKTFGFTTPFAWDGVSNILVDICHDNDINGSCSACYSTSGTVSYTTTPFTSVFGTYGDNVQSCGTTSNSTTSSSNRPNIIFGVQPTAVATTWTASSGTLYSSVSPDVAYAGQSASVVYARPTTGTTYTATATIGSCQTQGYVSVGVTPLPAFTVAPITICKGTSGTLLAVSPGSNSYSWTPIGGGATLTGTSVTVSPDFTTTYTVTATSNDTTPACSNVGEVTVTVNDPGSIVSGTTSRIVSPGQPTTFTVVTTGDVTYQWEVNNNVDGWQPVTNNTTYSGVTTATLGVQNITLAFDTYQYRCMVTGLAPCATLSPIEATLTVSNIGFSTQATDVNLCGATSTQFGIVTTGDAPYYVQWQMSTDGGMSFNDVYDGYDSVSGLTFAGANEFTPKTLTVSGISTVHNGYQFKCQLDFYLDSSIATLTVNTPVSITGDVSTTPLTLCKVTTVTNLPIATTGSIAGVQWQYATSASGPWAAVANATPAGTTYANPTGNAFAVTTTASTPVGTYYYKAFVTGAGSGPGKCADVESAVATITIVSPTITVSPSTASYCVPSPTGVTLTAGGSDIGNYVWSSTPAGFSATGATVVVTPSETTTYIVTGTDSYGCINTAQSTVTVGGAFTATATSSLSTVCPSSPVTLGTVITPSLTSYTINTIPYTFSASSSVGAFTPLTGATTSGLTATSDEAISATLPIGFSFNYGGTNYSNFRVSPNGFMTFNASGTNTLTNNLASTTTSLRPGIAPLWDDLQCRSGVTYKVSGVSPNRVLTVEWLNMEWNYNAANAVISFQAKLYETTNVIEYVYSQGATAVNTASSGASIGLMGTAATNYVSLQNSSAAPTVSTTTSANTITAKPATDQIYRFTPLTPVTYTYAWTASPADATISNASVANPTASPAVPTTYTVVATSNKGCTATSTVSVNVLSTTPVITQQPVTTLVKCQGETATFSVVATNLAPMTYQWFKDGVAITGNASALTATLNLTGTTPASSGNYTVTVTSCANPITSDVASLLVNPTPTVVAPVAQTYCFDATVPATPLVGTPSNVTFDISGGAALGLANQTGLTEIPSFTPTGSGVATITITPKANGCTGPAKTYTLTINALPVVPVLASNSAICEDSTLNLTAAVAPLSGYTYNGNSNVAFIDISTTGTSVGAVSDDSEHGVTFPAFTYNGVSYTSALIANNGAMVFGVTSGDITYVNGSLPTTVSAGSAFLAPLWDDLLPVTGQTSINTQTVGSKFIVQWTNEDNYGASGNGTITFQIQLDFASGQIHYVYSDATFVTANDGAASATIGLNYSASSALQYSLNTASIVNGQSITFTPAVYSYSWTGPNGFTSAVQNPSIANATPAASGTYTLEITNTNGCKISASTSATVHPTPTLATVLTNQVYYTGFVTPSIPLTGTPSGVTFTISGGAAAGLADATGLTAIPSFTATGAVATVTVTPVANGCSGVPATYQIAPIVVVVNITSNVCGGINQGLNNQINCTNISIPGYTTTGYRFRVTNTATGEVAYVDTTQHHFKLTDTDIYSYGTTFTIEVAVILDGNVQGFFGTPCPVTTASVQTTQVIAAQCGATLAAMNSSINATSVNQTNLYRFRVALASAPTTYFMIERTSPNFNLTMVAGLPLLYATEYRVDVQIRVKLAGFEAWSQYGSVCSVFTPAVPSTSLTLAACETVATSNTQQINAIAFAAATQYRFRLIGYDEDSNVNYDQYVDTPNAYFTLSMFSGLQPETQYTVLVSMNLYGTFVPYGKDCSVVTPGLSRDLVPTKVTDPFKATAYPNPFANNFMLSVTSSSSSAIAIKVYDMVGRLVEQRDVQLTDLATSPIGERYPSGVYNIVVTQDNTVEVVRVVKR